MARGAKTKCPACGAKNKADDRRCRVCTAIINPDAPQAKALLAKEPVDAAAQEVAASAAIQIPDAAPAPAPVPTAPVSDETFEPIEIDSTLQPRPPEVGAAPPPPLSDETFDPGSLDIDPTRRPRADGTPPPPVGDDEGFDPNGLVIDDPAHPRPSD